MNLRKILVLSTLSVTSCFSEIIVNTLEPNKSTLAEAAVDILESCYGNRITAVGVAGNFSETISRSLWSRNSSPVTLTDFAARVAPLGRQHRRYRLQVFAVAASSSVTMTNILREIRGSIWWNHMASFLLIAWPITSVGCSTIAHSMLRSAWEANLLDAKLLCHDPSTRKPMIYTFNPYTSRAPRPWHLQRIYRGPNDHPWTLFAREYEKGPEVCEALDYEKTLDLGGYEIRASVTSFGHERFSDRPCLGVFEDLICEILFPALNATPRILVHSSLNSIGNVDSASGRPSGILGEVASGASDVGLLGRFLTSFAGLTTAYPHYQCELRCITQYSGYKSQLEKIRSVLDDQSRVGVCLVCLLTVLFFRCYEGQSATSANLDALRLICNSSLPRCPRRLAGRIYLGSLFVFAVTVQGIYQGRLAALLTRQEPLRNVNTMRDLAELGHTIYGSSTYALYFDGPAFHGRYAGTEDVTCTERVLSDRSAACVGNVIVLIYDAAKWRLYLSRETLARIYVALPIRPDWPLERRVNALLRRAVEANWIQVLIDRVTYETYRVIRAQEDEHSDQLAKVLSVKQLGFAFAILGIGLGAASLSFVVEVYVNRERGH